MTGWPSPSRHEIPPRRLHVFPLPAESLTEPSNLATIATRLTTVKTIKARFSRGTFTPLDPPPPDLVHEGEEVLLAVSPIVSPSGSLVRETAGLWKGLLDAEELKRNIYADRLVATRPPVSF